MKNNNPLVAGNNNMDNDQQKVPLSDIAKVFLTVGTIGFGEGMSVIAVIQDYCVMRRKWLSVDEFSHGIALSQFLGPFAVNVSIFVGYRLRGFRGALTAVSTFLAPSVTIVIILTALYGRFHSVPSLQSALKGVGPVVVALIVSVAYRIGRSKVRSLEAVLLSCVTLGLSYFLKIQVVIIIFIAVLYGFLKPGGKHIDA